MHASNQHTLHSFEINGTGTLINAQFPPDAAVSFSGLEAKSLRSQLLILPPAEEMQVSTITLQTSFGSWQLLHGQALELKEFLNRCELRTDAEAAALGEPPPESDAGKGTRIDLGDGTHAYGKTDEEIAQLHAKAEENHQRIHAEFYERRKAQQ